jgi:hypothetical protein
VRRHRSLLEAQLQAAVLQAHAHVKVKALGAQALERRVWFFWQWGTPVLKYLS